MTRIYANGLGLMARHTVALLLRYMIWGPSFAPIRAIRG